jgi:hypothetical protein
VKPRPALDPGDSAYWKAIKSGDFVGVRDGEAFASRIAAEAGASGSDYTVGEVRSFALRGRESRKPAAQGEYRFIELRKEGEGSLYLALVEAEGGFELRLYFIPEGIACGTRDELIDADESWLFLPPPDPEDFKSCDLEYAPYPDIPEIEENGEGRKLLFAPAGSGKSLYGEAADTKAAVIITEYLAEAGEGEPEPANPLLLVLEEGWMRPDGTQPEEGGYVTILMGKVVRASDIEHFPA